MIFVSDIQAAVAREHGLDPAVMRENNGRGHDQAHPRQEAIVLATRLTEHSLSRIGELFGNRDHSTIINALKAVDRRARKKPEINERLRRVTLELVRR